MTCWVLILTVSSRFNRRRFETTLRISPLLLSLGGVPWDDEAAVVRVRNSFDGWIPLTCGQPPVGGKSSTDAIVHPVLRLSKDFGFWRCQPHWNWTGVEELKSSRNHRLCSFFFKRYIYFRTGTNDNGIANKFEKNLRTMYRERKIHRSENLRNLFRWS